jgi:hypothetical protein
MQPPQSVVQHLNVRKDEVINAPISIVWESVLEQMGPACERDEGYPMPMVLEPFPGGRWFRDLGNNTGHLWGHVQVIKPPKLIEIVGPLFMSYAAASHIQYRLTEEGGKTRLVLTHTAIGLIDPEHAKGVHEGWGREMKQIRAVAARRVKEGK